MAYSKKNYYFIDLKAKESIEKTIELLLSQTKLICPGVFGGILFVWFLHYLPILHLEEKSSVSYFGMQAIKHVRLFQYS